VQQYVNQLLKMLQEAHSNRYIKLPEKMECLRDVIDLEMSLEEDGHIGMKNADVI
jgi:hypothetical protein